MTDSHATSFVAGNWVAGTGEPSRAVAPRSGQHVGPVFRDVSPEQIRHAAEAAAEAVPALAALSIARTAALLEDLAAAITAAADDLVRAADEETALGERRLRGELRRTVAQLHLFAAHVRRGDHLEAVIDPADAGYDPAPRPDLRRVLIPVGPVAVFAASNFPFAFGVVGTDTAAALAAGCPVLAKAHPGHPRTAQLLARCAVDSLRRHDLPAAAFSLLHGSRHDVGSTLATEPAIEAVAFTGSTAGGHALHALVSQRRRPVPVFAEMGSTNPVFVLPAALREQGAEWLAEAFVDSLLLGWGQFCTCPGVVVIPDNDDGAAFVDRARELVHDHPAAPLLTPQVRDGYRRRRNAVAEHATLAASGQESAVGLNVAAQLVEADADDFITDISLREEVFGPAGIVVRTGAARFPEILASMSGNLTVTIHAATSDADLSTALAALAAQHAGRVVWNGWPTGVSVTRAMHHGGPWPATSAAAHTSVGVFAVRRFQRPIAFQDAPDSLLPEALRDANPLGLVRWVDGVWTTEPVVRAAV